MNKFCLIAVLFVGIQSVCAQEKKSREEEKAAMLKEVSADVCQCIDSIDVIGRRRKAIDHDISVCIDNKAVSYQMMSKLMAVNLDGESKEKKNVNIEIVTGKDSPEYKKYYYDMERYLMDNCPSMKKVAAMSEVRNEKSMSQNEKALDLYNRALTETKNGDYKASISLYEKAVKIDPEFAFAYDNMGICYRRLNDFDKAIECYQKSLRIDPNGRMPLQNMAVAYQYKQEYRKAVEIYEQLAELDVNDPEIFYGIGQIQAINLQDYEKGLDNLCKAYNLYVERKSPYRTDAEKLINTIFAQMKQDGKEKQFNEILTKNNIRPN